MSALVPYNQYGRLSEKYLEAYKRYFQQSLSIPRPFSTQSYSPSSFYPNNRYSFNDGSMPFPLSTSANSLTNFNQFNEQHKYAQYIRNLHQIQMNSSRRESARALPPSTFSSGTWYNTSGPIYVYEKETRYLPYPGLGGGSGFGGRTRRGFTGGMTTLISPGGGGGGSSMDLLPKIRVIFIPNGMPSLQQPCTGALGMPPFLFNRIAQPLCALPLPPPLPQIASLPVTPVVQQMIMQQYSNPIAVLPFTPNLEMARPLMPTYQAMPQILPQLQQPLIPTSALETPQFVPQSYIPPTLLPSNMPLRPNVFPPFPPFPLFPDSIPLPAPQTTSGYPSTCRACIPPPPPPALDISVTGQNWLQHCSACRNVPGDGCSLNNRPASGRFTPLLRPSSIQDRTCCPLVRQTNRYPHINSSPTTRPFLHDIPLPPGGVLISDEYLSNSDIAGAHRFGKNHSFENPRVFHAPPTSMALLGSRTDPNPIKKKRSRRKGRKNKRDTQSSPKTKSTSTITSRSSLSSSSSTSSWCSLCESAKEKKSQPSDVISNTDQQKSTSESRNVNLHYEYQPPEIQSVYNNNPKLKTSDTDSVSTFNPRTPSNNSQIIEKNIDTLSTPVSIDFIKNDDDQKSNSSLTLNQSQPSQNLVRKIIIIQRRRSSSLSSIHTISSDESFTVTSKQEKSKKKNKNKIGETF